MSVRPVLAVVPARGGSKGLPGKNIRHLAGIPLLAHSIACAERCQLIDRLIVSTDSDDIAAVARQYGAPVPFLRPADLATDVAPMLPVLQHALRAAEEMDGVRYTSLLLLDPTSPGRLPEDIERAVTMLDADPECDGIVAASQPDFNPYWHCVVEGEGGYVRDLIPGAENYGRRQDVPPVFRINAALYLWRREFLLSTSNWRLGKMRLLEIPDSRAIHIDTLEEFERAELLIRANHIRLPWIEVAQANA